MLMTLCRKPPSRHVQVKPRRVSLFWLTSVAVLLLPATVVAAPHYDQAQVIGVEPLYKTVSYETPVETCQMERVPYASSNERGSVTGPILGAIIGGALGNAVGHKKRNKQVGAVVGAVLGGSIGSDIARQQRRGRSVGVKYRDEHVCQVVTQTHQEEQFAGYNVRYVYAGATYNTVMPQDPGQTMRVRVHVRPAQ